MLFVETPAYTCYSFTGVICHMPFFAVYFNVSLICTAKTPTYWIRMYHTHLAGRQPFLAIPTDYFTIMCVVKHKKHCRFVHLLFFFSKTESYELSSSE